jgi:hypothetical protein
MRCSSCVHELWAPTFDRENLRAIGAGLISSSARERAIWGDRANGLTQRIALGGDGKRFVVQADEKLTAFVELESGEPDGGFLVGVQDRNRRKVTASPGFQAG